MYYGTNLYTNEPIELDRRNLSISTNRLICGKAGKGKTYLMKHEMLSVLSGTEDTVIVIADDESYDDLANKYGTTVKICNDNVLGKFIAVPKNKRIVFYDLRRVSNKLRLNAYKLCLKSAWKAVYNNYRHRRMTWIYIDEICPILRDETITELLLEMVKRARIHVCTVTLSTKYLDEIHKYYIGKFILCNTNFLTLLSIPEDDREIIYTYYRKKIPKSVIDKYFGDSVLHGTGLNIIYNGLFGEYSYFNEMFIPFKFTSNQNNQEVESK